LISLREIVLGKTNPLHDESYRAARLVVKHFEFGKKGND